MLTHGNCTPPQGVLFCGVPLVFACFFHSAISDGGGGDRKALFHMVRRIGVDGNVSWVSFPSNAGLGIVACTSGSTEMITDDPLIDHDMN